MSIWARTFCKNEDEKKILIVCLVNIYVSIEILFKQPKRGVNWVIKIYAKQTTQQFQFNAFIRTKIINLIKQDNKRAREEKSNTWFLRGSANRAYVHASNLTGLEDSTKQVSKTSTALIIDFKGVNKPLQ